MGRNFGMSDWAKTIQPMCDRKTEEIRNAPPSGLYVRLARSQAAREAAKARGEALIRQIEADLRKQQSWEDRHPLLFTALCCMVLGAGIACIMVWAAIGSEMGLG